MDLANCLNKSRVKISQFCKNEFLKLTIKSTNKLSYEEAHKNCRGTTLAISFILVLPLEPTLVLQEPLIATNHVLQTCPSRTLIAINANKKASMPTFSPFVIDSNLVDFFSPFDIKDKGLTSFPLKISLSPPN